MEIKKESENVRRSFAGETQSETIESVQYNVLDDNGNVVGNATVWNGSANVNFSLSGFNSVAEGAARVEALFEGIAENVE